MTNILIRPLLVAVLAAMAAPVLASPAPGTQKLVINTSGLNLSTPAGQQALLRRVSAAIDQTCSAHVVATLDADGMNECREAMTAEVTPQVKAMLPPITVVASR